MKTTFIIFLIIISVPIFGQKSEKDRKKAMQQEEKAYRKVIEFNSLSEYDRFLRMYPESKYYEDIKARYIDGHYALAKSINTFASYTNFIAENQNSKYYSEILSYIDTIFLRSIKISFYRTNYTDLQGEYFLINKKSYLSDCTINRYLADKLFKEQTDSILNAYMTDKTKTLIYTFTDTNTTYPMSPIHNALAISNDIDFFVREIPTLSEVIVLCNFSGITSDSWPDIKSTLAIQINSLINKDASRNGNIKVELSFGDIFNILSYEQREKLDH